MYVACRVRSSVGNNLYTLNFVVLIPEVNKYEFLELWVVTKVWRMHFVLIMRTVLKMLESTASCFLLYAIYQLDM